MDKDTELRKLALVLQAEGRTLPYLQGLNAERIRRLRLFVQHGYLNKPVFTGLQRWVPLSGFVPAKLAAWLAERVLGPVMAAYLVHYLPTRRAARMASHVSPQFLADCAPYLIPETIYPVLDEVPLRLLTDATRLLAARKQYATLGSLFDVTPESRVLALLSSVPSPFDRLSVSRYVSQKARMAKLMDELSDAELKELIGVAFTSDEFLSEMGALVAHMNEQQIKRTAKVFAGLLDSHVQGLLRRLMSSPRQIERFAVVLQALPEKSLNTLVGAVDGLDEASYQALQLALMGIDKATEVLPKVLRALHADAKSRIGGLLKTLTGGQ